MTSFRVATVADVGAMHRVRMSVRENALRNPDLVRREHYEAMLEREGRGWVCEIEGAIVGFAIADLARSNVWALFVDPAHERLGIGRRLHDLLLEWMFANGAERVWLSTARGTRAEEFYARAGWTAVGSEPSGEVRFERTRP
jgi:GNAT superfamily N-acetyltransferase